MTTAGEAWDAMNHQQREDVLAEVPAAIQRAKAAMMRPEVTMPAEPSAAVRIPRSLLAAAKMAALLNEETLTAFLGRAVERELQHEIRARGTDTGGVIARILERDRPPQE